MKMDVDSFIIWLKWRKKMRIFLKKKAYKNSDPNTYIRSFKDLNMIQRVQVIILFIYVVISIYITWVKNSIVTLFNRIIRAIYGDYRSFR
jgi:hypothetical protein